MEFVPQIAASLSIKQAQVEAVLSLFSEGATIPFIARYRKDKTGALDEVMIGKIQDEAKFRKEFAERKSSIEKAITEQGKMTDDIQGRLDKALTLAELEDIYLPYKQKRKTKASVARENGLGPLADLILEQPSDLVPENAAAGFITEQVKSIDDALQGARDIIAESINENADVRNTLRKLFEDKASLQSKIISDKETEAAKYKDYFDFSEPIRQVPSHRVLAVLRGFMEGLLRMTISPEEEEALDRIESQVIKNRNAAAEQVKKAAKDAWKRLLQPSLETEFRASLKQKADEDAIQVFAENLRQLLLGSPLGSKRLLAIDPGYRTGCKLVCLDEKGELKETSLIFIHETGRQDQSIAIVKHLVSKHDIEAIAIGDGTAGRETELMNTPQSIILYWKQ